MIKEKKFGKIKVRTCTYVRPQGCYIPKEYASSPTITLEDLFTSILIDTHEGIDMTIFGVPRSYLNADMPEGNSSC